MLYEAIDETIMGSKDKLQIYLKIGMGFFGFLALVANLPSSFVHFILP